MRMRRVGVPVASAVPVTTMLYPLLVAASFAGTPAANVPMVVSAAELATLPVASVSSGCGRALSAPAVIVCPASIIAAPSQCRYRGRVHADGGAGTVRLDDAV